MRGALFGLVARTNRLAQPIAEAYATANMVAKVRITRPDGWAFNPETGQETPKPDFVVYPVAGEDGRARIYPVSGAVIQGMGDEPQYFDTTYVSIPLVTTNTPRIDDVIEVIEHKDPRTVGRLFRCTGHEVGGQLPAVQRMSATGIAPSKQWSTP